jgi:CheY-like chemotaxis protein
MIFVRSAAEVIAYLNGEGRFALRYRYPLPAIIVIDLSKPRMNPWELVAWLKAQPELSHIQICFIGAEDDEATVLQAQSHGPCFFTKPEDTESYEKLLLSLNAEDINAPH